MARQGAGAGRGAGAGVAAMATVAYMICLSHNKEFFSALKSRLKDDALL